MPTPSENLRQALQFHQGGDAARAEALYRKVLCVQPENAEAWNLLGAACVQLRRLDEGIDYLRRAVALQPAFAAAHENLGVAFAHLHRYDEAAVAFRKAAAHNPANPGAHAHLGHALVQVSQTRHAEAAAGQTPPPSAAARTRLEALSEAVAAFRQALRLRPGDTRLLDTLGWNLLALGRRDEAVSSFQEALRLDPGFARAQSNLGEAYRQLGRLADAEACFRAALVLEPDNAETFNRLGAVLVMQDRLDEASAALRECLRREPNHFSALQNLASAAFEGGDVEEARGLLRQAVALKPDYPAVHMALGQALLLLGEFEAGWREYEWRWFTPEYTPRPFPQPCWRGEPLAGRTILVYAEQGHGDTLQFLRYAALLKARGATVVVECQPALVELLTRTPGVDRVIPLGSPLPPFDTHAAVLSLPAVFGTTLATLPANVPYLFADPERVARWRSELSAEPGFKVGLVWQGNPKFTGDRKRSPALAHFAPLARVPGLRLYGLQKGHGREQIGPLAEVLPLTDLAGRFDDNSFADAAAAMTCLDLVVTSDTAPAHLAGGLGVPAWVVLHASSDWRWLRGRDDCPWYPTMRLFRQERPGDWDGVFARVAEALREKSGAGGARGSVSLR